MATIPGRPCSLPVELVEHIVDFNFDDSATLRACSTVSCAWARQTRYHLFASIKLYDSQRIQDFAAILDASPHIARYVRHVKFLAWLGKPAARAALTAIALQLTAVRAVTCAGQQLQPAWDEVLGQLPSVTYLRLRATWCDRDAFVGLVRAFPALTDLVMETSMLAAVGDLAVPLPAGPQRRLLPFLARMIVVNHNGLPNDFQSLLLRHAPPHLESLTAQLGSVEDVEILCEFLNRCGNKTLRDLHVEITYQRQEHYDDGMALLGQAVGQCTLRSLGLTVSPCYGWKEEFRSLYEAMDKGLKLTEATNFPICMFRTK